MSIHNEFDFPIRSITDLSAPDLLFYANLSENQLLHYYEPYGGVFMAESPMIIERAIRAGYEPISLLIDEKELCEKRQELLSLCRDIPIYSADFNELTKKTGFRFTLTRGALCAMHRHPLPSVEEVCRNARRIAILEDVVNPTNVGAIFRSAAALGIDAILLTPKASDPLYRRAIRVSMATVFQIPWTYFDDPDTGSHVKAKTDREDETACGWPHPAMEQLREMGFKTVAMALKEDSLRLDDPRILAENKLAIIMGTEGDGLANHTIDGCDYTVMIPMDHGVDSLNVAAASAVAFYALCKHGISD